MISNAVAQSPTLDDTVTRSDQAAAEPLDGEHIILDLNSGEYFGTGHVGSYIWDRLNGQCPLSDIAASVAEHFDVDIQQAGADLLNFVTQLIDRGLASPIDSG